jgi:hypothetical protein
VASHEHDVVRSPDRHDASIENGMRHSGPGMRVLPFSQRSDLPDWARG